MRANPLYQSFNAGEFSSLMIARTAFPKYPSGLEICQNAIPMVEGAYMRRPALRFAAEAKISSKKVRLKRFEFSTVQAYMLEFGDQYIRFYRHQGQIQLSGSPYEIASPYLEADLPNLAFTQSADILYIFHKAYAPRKLIRAGHTSWTLSQIEWIDGPYLDQNITATTLTPSATSGSVTITASSVTGINGGSGFLSTDVGRLIRVSNPATGEAWGYAQITAVGSTTSVTVTTKRNFSTTTATAAWKLGAWSGTTGYPGAAGFFQQRFVAAATTSQPQTIWFGQTGDFENQSPDSPNPTGGVWDGTIQDDDAFDRTISADEVNGIVWMASLQRLIFGTNGGEWIVSSDGPILKPNDITLSRHTKIGSHSPASPVIVGNRVLFLQRAQRKIIELAYSFEDSAYRDTDLTRLARHITSSGISRIAYAQEPHKLIFCVRNDGAMAVMSYNRAEDIVGWSRYITDGTYEDIDVIPGANGAGQIHDSSDRDEVWCVVKRTINGQTKRYIEVFERDFETGHAQEDAYYADSLVTYDGASTSTITGLSHLEGKTVSIWANGAKRAPVIVSGGSITLDAAATVVQIGLPYTHIGKTLKAEFGAQAGTAVGKVKRFHALTFILLNSHSMKYGNGPGNLDEVDFREVSNAMDTAVPLFTGEYKVDFDGDTGSDPRIYWESDMPAPFTLLAIAPEMRTNELI